MVQSLDALYTSNIAIEVKEKFVGANEKSGLDLKNASWKH